MTSQRVQQITQQHGFQPVSDHQANAVVWESNGARLRTTLRGKIPGRREILCELILPNRKELLPFVFNDVEETCHVRFYDEQILKRLAFASEKAYERFLVGVSSVAALLKDDDWKGSRELLLSVPLDAVTAVPSATPSLGLLKDILRVFRAFRVRTNYPSLLAHLKALAVGHVFEIHPSLCLSHSESKRFLDLAGQLGQLNGSLVLVNGGLIETDDRLHAGVNTYFERLNLLPSFGGARFLLHQSKGGRSDGGLPTLYLPDVAGAPFLPRLDQASLAANAENLALVRGFHAGGELPGAAIEWLRANERLAVGASPQGANRLRYQENPPSDSKAGQLFELVERTRSMLTERVVGHEEVVNQLALRLPLWFLLERDKPLVLSLVGPSGCGKNHLLEVVAAVLQMYFQLATAHLVIYNCGQAWDEKRWELTGVGCGHVGSERPGLIEMLKSGSVFLADELDKRLSQPGDFQSFLIQWLDDGFIRNGHGDLVRTPRCVIALAMNAGAEANADRWRRIGFGEAGTPPIEAVREHYREHLEKRLLPALQGRIDVRLFFSHLTQDNLVELACRELDKARREFEALGLAPWTADLRTLARQLAGGANPDLGARAILHAVRDYKTQLIESLCQCKPQVSSPNSVPPAVTPPGATAS